MTAEAIPRSKVFGTLTQLLENRTVLSVVFMLPAVSILVLFLAYPLGLGIWMGFTDVRIGRPGVFVGLENYVSLFDDDVFWLSVFNTLVYTIAATIAKFGLGLWLALLLNKPIPLKAIIRAIVLLPYIVPTVLSAIAFWWIYDPQFSIISWMLQKFGLIDQFIDFLGVPWNARWSVIVANVWRGIPSWRSACLRVCRPFHPPSMKQRHSTAPMPGSAFVSSRCRC
jgi:multiple sugar transport system permease protein